MVGDLLPPDSAERESFLDQSLSKLCKGHGVFRGIVREYDAEKDVYKIVYEDGDEEELDYERMKAMVLKRSKGPGYGGGWAPSAVAEGVLEKRPDVGAASAATDAGTKRTRVRPEHNASRMTSDLSSEQCHAEKRRKTQERREKEREKRAEKRRKIQERREEARRKAQERREKERREKERRRTQDAEGQEQGTRERARVHATIGLLLVALSTPSNQEEEGGLDRERRDLLGAALQERSQVPSDQLPAGSRHSAEVKRQHKGEDESMQAQQLPSVVMEGRKARSRLLNAAHILSQLAPRNSAAANVVQECRGKCQSQPCPAERANLAAKLALKLAARWPHANTKARALQRKR